MTKIGLIIWVLSGFNMRWNSEHFSRLFISSVCLNRQFLHFLMEPILITLRTFLSIILQTFQISKTAHAEKFYVLKKRDSYIQNVVQIHVLPAKIISWITPISEHTLPPNEIHYRHLIERKQGLIIKRLIINIISHNN